MNNLDPQRVSELSKENIIGLILQLNDLIDQHTQDIVGLKEELYNRINPDGEVVAGYALNRRERINVSNVPEGIAEEYGALKTVTTKKVDSTVVKALMKKGIDLPGVSVTHYLSMRNLEKKEE